MPAYAFLSAAMLALASAAALPQIGNTITNSTCKDICSTMFSSTR